MRKSNRTDFNYYSAFSSSFNFSIFASNIMHKQKLSLSCFSCFKNSWVTDFRLGFLKHLGRHLFLVVLCFHWSTQIMYSWRIVQSMCRSKTSLIHSEDNLVGQPQQSSLISISFPRWDVMNMGCEPRMQLWQSKLCCLTVSGLALSPTRTVCLANKGKGFHSLLSSSLFL